MANKPLESGIMSPLTPWCNCNICLFSRASSWFNFVDRFIWSPCSAGREYHGFAPQQGPGCLLGNVGWSSQCAATRFLRPRSSGDVWKSWVFPSLQEPKKLMFCRESISFWTMIDHDNPYLRISKGYLVLLWFEDLVLVSVDRVHLFGFCIPFKRNPIATSQLCLYARSVRSL